MMILMVCVVFLFVFEWSVVLVDGFKLRCWFWWVWRVFVGFCVEIMGFGRFDCWFSWVFVR